MQCVVVSRAGQVIANGRLMLHKNDDGTWRLNMKTDGGRLLEGGVVDADGDLSAASDAVMFQMCGLYLVGALQCNAPTEQ